MLTVHQILARAAVAFFVILTLWGFWLFLRREPLGGSWLGALAVGVLVLLALDVAGLAAWPAGGGPRQGVHLIYGVASPAIAGGAFLSAPRMRPDIGRIVLVGAALLTCFLLYRGFATS